MEQPQKAAAKTLPHGRGGVFLIDQGGIIEYVFLKRFGEGLKLVQPGRSSQDNEIDSITGATMTSDAFISIINKNLGEQVPVIKQGEGQ